MADLEGARDVPQSNFKKLCPSFWGCHFPVGNPGSATAKLSQYPYRYHAQTYIAAGHSIFYSDSFSRCHMINRLHHTLNHPYPTLTMPYTDTDHTLH